VEGATELILLRNQGLPQTRSLCVLKFPRLVMRLENSRASLWDLKFPPIDLLSAVTAFSTRISLNNAMAESEIGFDSS